MNMAVNIVFETNDRSRILKSRFIDRKVSDIEELEELLAEIRTQYELAEMANDDIRELDRKAKFDPTVL